MTRQPQPALGPGNILSCHQLFKSIGKAVSQYITAAADHMHHVLVLSCAAAQPPALGCSDCLAHNTCSISMYNMSKLVQASCISPASHLLALHCRSGLIQHVTCCSCDILRFCRRHVPLLAPTASQLAGPECCFGSVRTYRMSKPVQTSCASMFTRSNPTCWLVTAAVAQEHIDILRLLQVSCVSISTHSIPICLALRCCDGSVSMSCVLALTSDASAGVMCLNFHPQHPNLLALGCYDGSVSVYDVRKGSKPLYTSTAATGKHTDPVWEIFWQVSLHFSFSDLERVQLFQNTHRQIIFCTYLLSHKLGLVFWSGR